MTATIDQNLFTRPLLEIFAETFETHYGIYLDKDTALFNTLTEISADEASQPVGGQCATLAAQVAHIKFYLEVMEKDLLNQPTGKVDWDEIWRSVNQVTPDEWRALRTGLEQAYRRIETLLRELPGWNNEDTVGRAIAVVVHSAYHLGEIRQALCTLKPQRSG